MTREQQLRHRAWVERHRGERPLGPGEEMGPDYWQHHIDIDAPSAELFAEYDEVGLAKIEIPVVGHPRKTEHGIEQVDPHMREIEVDLSPRPTSVRVVDTREFEEDEEGNFHAIPGTGSSRSCDRCGRQHEVHVYVTYPDKELCVGTSCATDAEAPIVKKAVTSQKRLDTMERQLARAQERQVAFELIRIRVEAMELPPIEQDEEWDGRVQKFRMGDSVVWQHDEGAISEERRGVLEDAWREQRFVEEGVKSTTGYFLSDEMTKLQKRIATAQKKLSEVGLATVTVERPVVGHVRVTEHGVQHVDPHLRETEISIDDDLGKSVAPPQIKRLDEFGEKARKGLDKYIADNDIDLDGIADDILEGFDHPELIEKGERWYREEFHANAQKLADEYDVDVETAAAVIAITSARSKWVYTDSSARTIYRNLDVARNYLRLWREGAFDGMSAEEAARTVKTGYIPNKGFGQNVIALLKGEMTIDEAVTGAKRRSFYDNGMFPETSMSITNDVWMSVYLAKHSSMSEDTAQGVLSGDGPLYLQNEGVHAKPGYLILGEAVMRAHEQAIARGLVPSDWLPHQTQATAWVKLVGPQRKDPST